MAELFFEHELETEAVGSELTEMLLGPKHREDACWNAFLGQCYANENTSFDADIVYHVLFEHCDHARLHLRAPRMVVRMNVVELRSTTVRLRFRHFNTEGGQYSPTATCEREVICLRDFGSRSIPAEWPSPILNQLRRLGAYAEKESAPVHSKMSSILQRILASLLH